MKLFLSLAMMAMFVPCLHAQTTADEPGTRREIMLGSVNRSAIDSTQWYKSNRQLYIPTTDLIRQIDSLDTGDSVVVVFGSWCSDSHVWVPIFLNIADSTTLGRSMRFVAVPRSPEGQRKLTRGLDIEKVPTFIFYHDGKELGRIVETPSGDIGDDIVNILKGGK